MVRSGLAGTASYGDEVVSLILQCPLLPRQLSLDRLSKDQDSSDACIVDSNSL